MMKVLYNLVQFSNTFEGERMCNLNETGPMQIKWIEICCNTNTMVLKVNLSALGVVKGAI